MRFVKHLVAAATIWTAALGPRPAEAVVRYSNNFKPYTTNDTFVSCIDYYTGTPIAGAQLNMTLYWVADSNSHLHANTPGHPVSTISPTQGTTGSNGSLPVRIYTTLIGQDEYIQSNCSKSGYTTRITQAYFTVGYADVYYNNHPEIWVNIGATGNHGGTDYNRYMTTYAATQLYYTTYDYFGFYGIPTNPVPADQKGL
ncbi:hypothetical protein FBQ96_15585 [Nitrospirales bacterium NOB]|nr:hypothetical protein [Nitrospirales bacterium NOB]